jgi:hypothetical protein
MKKSDDNKQEGICYDKKHVCDDKSCQIVINVLNDATF